MARVTATSVKSGLVGSLALEALCYATVPAMPKLPLTCLKSSACAGVVLCLVPAGATGQCVRQYLPRWCALLLPSCRVLRCHLLATHGARAVRLSAACSGQPAQLLKQPSAADASYWVGRYAELLRLAHDAIQPHVQGLPTMLASSLAPECMP